MKRKRSISVIVKHCCLDDLNIIFNHFLLSIEIARLKKALEGIGQNMVLTIEAQSRNEIV